MPEPNAELKAPLRDQIKTLTSTSHDEARDACVALHATGSVQELVATMEKKAAELLRCEHVTFFRLERHDKVVNLVGMRNEGKTRVSFPLGEGIAGSVARDKGYYICSDPKDDPLYVAAIDAHQGTVVKNILAAAVEAGGDTVGVLLALNKRGRTFEEGDAYWLQLLATHGALAYVRARRSEEGWQVARNLAEAVATAVDNKHVSTVGHSDRTRRIALAIGREMDLSADELLELELAAWLHDVGRLALAPEAFEGADDSGANHPYASPKDPLHLVLTEALLRGIKLPEYLNQVPKIALAHHECMDGTGTRGMQADDLPLAARILAVANTFDLLATGRAPACNGKRMDEVAAVAALKALAGKALDAQVVDQLIRKKLYRIELRRFPRCEYEAPLEVTVLGASGAESKIERFTTKALDLSEGGIFFQCSKKLPGHALLNLKIALPTEKLEALARVARQLPGADGKGFKVGAYFLWYGT